MSVAAFLVHLRRGKRQRQPRVVISLLVFGPSMQTVAVQVTQ